ncbi:hypothetical protein EV699_11739 [Plasticicumulans lactativorans]|uniref:Putative phosphoenolpyruvate synthase regulatory protein n=1 Tax=Plasticicumulans lactativorans TaxID=1133106 RepID=A0A4V2SCK5_9GAMM|nr:pyruvate, water dikinase regulatory protein [Plasticicumulans lactativorans]TCO79730.1 hypothetical protein EV699_11739 [Plasticicumulans lactativorans]
MSAPARSVFYVSDGTGLTAETLGHSLLAQFEGFAFRQVRLGGVDTFARLYACVDQVRSAREADGVPPLVLATLVDPEAAQALRALDCVFFDLFETFIGPLEAALQAKSIPKVRDARLRDHRARFEAINFALAHDDGASDARLDEADVILVGVSRSGKTPTCLYLAMQHAVKAANYPLIPDDFERGRLPQALLKMRPKLFGLTVAAERLAGVREQRRPGSRYASFDNCRAEVQAAQALMRREGIRWLDSSVHSVEELAGAILEARGLGTRAG